MLFAFVILLTPPPASAAPARLACECCSPTVPNHIAPPRAHTGVAQ